MNECMKFGPAGNQPGLFHTCPIIAAYFAENLYNGLNIALSWRYWRTAR